MIRAAIDVGSNSVLLLVAKWNGETWIPVAEKSSVTGLGAGTKSTGVLSPQGAQKTLIALNEMFALARQLGAAHIRAGGTMALRIAHDADQFCRQAKDQNTPVEIISGDEEARLGFLAVANDSHFQNSQRLSIVDVGGHSTEIVTAERTDQTWDTLFKRSFAFGALGLRETLCPDPVVTMQQQLAACTYLDDSLGMAYLPHQCGQVVALGATGTNLITLREGMTEWDANKVHGQILDYEEIGRAVGLLCKLDDQNRARLPGIETGREHTIHIGSLILERCLFALRAHETSVSTRGWRHAWLAAF